MNKKDEKNSSNHQSRDNSNKNNKNESSNNNKKQKKHHQRKKDKESKKNKSNIDSDNSDSKGDDENQKSVKREQKQIKDLIAENFVLLTEIGHGAFGQIYLSFNMRDNIEVAVKKEMKKPQKIPQLRTEAKIYQTLLNIPLNSDMSGMSALAQEDVQGVTKFYGMGELIDCYYLIIEFLGPNLIELLNYCGMKKFTIATVCLLALQILNRIENLHKHHFIHRDIKPENFLIGTENKSNIVYLVDFGLSKRYKNPKNHQHIPYREGRFLTGTARYVSINTHLGIEQSRRDDLESIGYVMVFFLKGSLPWQGLKTGTDKYTRIMEKKLQIPTEILCFGLPDEISIYLNYCKSLRFEDRPDYDYLRGLFIKLLGTCTCVYGLTKENLKFDWCFEDQNYLWQLYSQEKSVAGNFYTEDENKENNTGNNSPSSQKRGSLMNKALTKINEANEHKKQNDKDQKNKGNNDSDEQNSNENNPNAGDSKESSESSDKENNKSVSDESDETIKIEFNGQTQAELLKNRVQNQNQPGEHEKINLPENIDKYINNLMLGCRLPKKITLEEIKKKSTQQNDKSEDTVQAQHGKPQNINKLLDKINNNKSVNMNNSEDSVSLFNEKVNKDKQKKIIQDQLAKQREESEKEEKTEKNNSNIQIVENNANNSVNQINFDEIIKDIKENDPFTSNSIEKKRSKEIEENKGTDNTDDVNSLPFKANSDWFTDKNKVKASFEEIIAPHLHHQSYKKPLKEMTGRTKEIMKMKLAKENLIKISKESYTKYYIVLNDLGQGSYGKVKKVKHIQLNEIRAMKIVNKKSPSSANEIEALRKISHPNIVNIFEIFEDSYKYYIMSEFCEGGELFDAITSKGYYSELDAAKIMKQILQAVNYLHDNGVVHRDLKPENIMLLSNQSELKLIDFGTVVQKPSKGKYLKKFIGTSYYIAPEVIQERYNEKCDVWSCGVILYILLCGYPPFNGSSNHEIYNAIQFSRLSFNKDEWFEISEDAINLIKLMLDKNPDNRPSAETCLNHKWFKICLDDNIKNLDIIKSNKAKIIDKMALFVQQNKFKQAVLQFITTEFNLKKEEEELRKMFREFDKEEKGTISRDVFVAQIEKIDGSIASKEMLIEIFKKLDLDGSGTISYNEFLTSIIDSKKILTEDRLERAFKMFDRDHNGLLSVDEIKSFFGGEEKTWKKVLKEVDKNGDGEVDFEEFKTIMIGFDPDEIVGENTIIRGK